MLIIITYDVETVTKEGQRRLRKVAKICEKKGQRVQNSVFECILDYGQYLQFKETIKKEIDPKLDSIRFYNLGNKYDTKIESYGKDIKYRQDGILIV